MLTVNKLLARGRGLAPALVARAATLTLDWDTRQKSRFDGEDSSGRALGVFLPRGTPLRGGDVLVAEDGSLVRVAASPQPVLLVQSPGSDALDLLRAAYHLGNRHVQLEVRADRLQLEPDHVLAEMLRRMGLDVSEVLAPFEPEAGAYAAHSGHAHPHHGSHDHEPGHAHDQASAPAPTHTGLTAAMSTTEPTPALSEREATARLQVMWLASPALPVGGFSYSEGLEAAVESGRVSGEVEAGDWLEDQLHLCLARAELAVVAQAMAAWRDHDTARAATLNDWMSETRESAEARLQTEQMGRSLTEWLRNGGAGTDASDPRIEQLAALRPAPTWPVAFALAASLGAAAPADALLAYAFGWAENMVQAAMKAVPLGQAAAQRILARLAAAIPAATTHAARLDDATRQASAPLLSIVSAQHEVQYSRLFRS